MSRAASIPLERARAEDVDIRFVHANANALHELESHGFHVVVTPIRLMHM
jgi:hypothetical protein